MKKVLISILSLSALSMPSQAVTCYRPNPAGGSIPYECVRGEELEAEAPSLGTSSIPTMDERELEAIEQLMNGAVKAAEPVQAVPRQ